MTKLPEGWTALDVCKRIEHMDASYEPQNAAALIEAYAQKRAEQIQAERDGLMRDLVSLTVGGSEFVNDPKACVEYVRKRQAALQDSLKKQILKLILTTKRAERLLAAAQAEHAAVHDFFGSNGSSSMYAAIWRGEQQDADLADAACNANDELRAAITEFQKGEQ